MITKDELKEYGEVQVCEEVNGKFHVKITKGFDSNAIKTFEIMKKITESVGDKYPIVDKCVTDDNLFDFILKPKS